MSFVRDEYFFPEEESENDTDFSSARQQMEADSRIISKGATKCNKGKTVTETEKIRLVRQT